MGISDRRERERIERRNAIVDAAETLFFSKGMVNTSIDEIADAVELSKGTIYLYFKSKEELYCAIIQRAMDILGKMMEEAAKVGNNGLERLFSQGMAFYEFYKQYPKYFETLFHRELHRTLQGKENALMEEIMMQGEALFETAVALIKGGIEDGSIRPDVDPYKTALSLDGIFSGLLRVVSLEEDHLMRCHKVTSEELIRYSLSLIEHALKNNGTSKGSANGIPSGAAHGTLSGEAELHTVAKKSVRKKKKEDKQ